MFWYGIIPGISFALLKHMQLEMLKEEFPKGFQLLPAFVTAQEELQLLSFFQDLNWQKVSMHGVVARRQVVHFGYDYEFNKRTLSPTRPIPQELQFLVRRSAKALRVMSGEIAEVLVTHYPAGAGIGWHRDAPMFEKLLGVSLAGDCAFRMRYGGPGSSEVFKTTLTPGTAYIIEGEARWKWQHHIPPVKSDRYSITFRTLRKSSPYSLYSY